MSTALVLATPLDPVTPPGTPPGVARSRASAGFIAQLAATRAQAPQTRIRRRAAPQEAIAAYGALLRRSSAPGRAVCRSL